MHPDRALAEYAIHADEHIYNAALRRDDAGFTRHVPHICSLAGLHYEHQSEVDLKRTCEDLKHQLKLHSASRRLDTRLLLVLLCVCHPSPLKPRTTRSSKKILKLEVLAVSEKIQKNWFSRMFQAFSDTF